MQLGRYNVKSFCGCIFLIATMLIVQMIKWEVGLELYRFQWTLASNLQRSSRIWQPWRDIRGEVHVMACNAHASDEYLTWSLPQNHATLLAGLLQVFANKLLQFSLSPAWRSLSHHRTTTMIVALLFYAIDWVILSAILNIWFSVGHGNKIGVPC